MQDNFEFELITEYSQYDSSRDKTNITPTALIQNSKNMYKSLSGTIVTREGLKVRGALNPNQAGVVSSYEFSALIGTVPIRVTSDGVLSIEYNNNDGNGPIWYNLLTGLTDLRFIFSSGFVDINQSKNILLAVNGQVQSVYYWEGGISQIANTTPLVTGVVTQGNSSSPFATLGGFALGSGGTGYNAGDLLTLVGGNNNATVQVTAVSSGVVTALAIYLTNQGSGYIAGTVATTGGHGIGATVVINSVFSGGTITKSKISTTFFQDGFSMSENAGLWQFIYNGVTYTYQGGQNTQTLTGVTPDPSVIPSGAIIISNFFIFNNLLSIAGLSSGLLTNYTFDFIIVVTNQLYVGSRNSSFIFVASQTNPVSFAPTSNGGIGTPFQIQLSDNAVGLTQKNNVPYVFSGSSSLTSINISSQEIQLTAGITTTIQVVGTTKISFPDNECPISQEFIDTNGEYFIWLGQDNQVHVFGAIKEVFLSDKAPILSVPVEDEFNSINFTGGALRFIGQYIFITAPLLGIHYFYRHREFIDEGANQKTEQVWMPPQVSGISRFANIDGIIYGHSNINPMIYQIFNTNQWHDDSPNGSLAYECVMAVAYQQMPGKGKSVRRQGKLRFDKVYVEGYMDRGSELYADVYFDYQGASGVQTLEINTVNAPAKLFSYESAPPLGLDTLGDNPLGDALNPSIDLHEHVPKFRSIRKVTPVNCYEYAIELYSYNMDARWEIIALGVNIELAPESPRDLLVKGY